MNLARSKAVGRSQSGFGLLEVLVSLAIFASVGFTLLAWLQQSMDTVHRLRTFYQLQDARKTTLELARTLNPSQKPKGETVLGRFRVVWEAVPEGDERIQAGYPLGTGRYRLQLYTVTFSVYRVDEVTPWFIEKLTLIGYRFAGVPNDGLKGVANG